MWDYALDPSTGDWLFGPSNDLLGATSTELIDQRIVTRCKIPRGTFIHNPEIGSSLHTISRYPSGAALSGAPGMITSALEGMEDISVTDIDVELDDNNRIIADVKYDYNTDTADEGEEAPVDTTPEYSARVTV